MAASNTINKIKVKSPEGNIVEVYPVDARELVAQGWTAHNAQIEPADWVKDKKVVKQKTNEEKSDLEDAITAIKSMTSKELVSYVEENDFTIKGFEDMNLKEKRLAVIEILESAEEVDEDEGNEDL